jgi:D-glycero-beta-D-manno-heptose-7-phosphate kinase
VAVEGARIRELIRRFANLRILVIGDLMLDEFLWGQVSRISPEAPVPVVDVVRESQYPGGAANVARNLREFSGNIAVMGLAGTDAAGRRLLELLDAAGIGRAGVLEDPAASTTVKTRIIARNQQVVRVDRERQAALNDRQLAWAKRHLEEMVAEVDGIVVADYGKGFVSQPLADEISRLARRHQKILTVDPHPHTALAWHGATAIKPNRLETFLAAGVTNPPAPVEPVACDQALLAASRKLLDVWETGCLLVTLGDLGMLLFHGDATPVHLPARAHEVFDVSGAGDTAIAVFTLGLAAGADPVEAAKLSNCASGIVVGKVGTATVTAAEVAAACGSIF